MGRKQKIFDRLTDRLDLTGEALGQVPVAEIWGDNRVMVENHRGVLGYSREEILVQVSYGTLKIMGTNLMLTSMTGAQLIVSGKIEGVSLKRRESC